MRRSGLALLLLVLQAWTVPAGAPAQAPAVHYVHDALNRLIAVIDAQGNAATYTYDATGNLLRIDRIDAPAGPGRVAITLLAPGRGAVGAAVEVFGRGFAPSPAGNALAFNGTPAAVAAATPTRLLTAVPPGATTGPVTLTTALGTATSPVAFHVLAPRSLAVAPAHATVTVMRSLQLEALDGGMPTPAVRWSVNGIPGGDASLGTVSAAGLYTAPAAVPAPPTVAVSATDPDDPTAMATASVTVRAPVAAFLASPGLSVGVGPAPVVVSHGIATALSVHAPAGAATLAVGPAVGVGHEPLVRAVLPGAIPRGAAGVTVTIRGAGLAGATEVAFLGNGAPDPDLAATGLTVDPTGAEATVSVSVASGAAPGPRVVWILTPAGGSTTVGTGGNLLTVHQP